MEIEMTWPEILLDSIDRVEGLILLSGTRNSQLLMIEKVVMDRSPDRTICRIDRIHRESRSKALEEADVVIYHGMCDANSILALLDLCEEGRLVIQVVMAPSILSSVRKVLSALDEINNKHSLWRYADQLTLMLNQMPISDIKGQSIFVHEIVLGTPAVKELMLAGKLTDLEAALRGSQEDRGMVSYNQALLKLLIRRKIDLKTAFSKTRDPENLDSLLKRVGI